MREKRTAVVKQHNEQEQVSVGSEHTVKPIFIYSREDYFDAPKLMQKSHQISTLSVPQESPNIVAMPTNLPSYVLAENYAMPNAQLIRRRIDYQETAEYRVVGGTDNVITKQVPATYTKPLTVRVDEDVEGNGKRTTTMAPTAAAADNGKLSSGSSGSSSTRRRSHFVMPAPTDRVLRSQLKMRRDTLQAINSNVEVEEVHDDNNNAYKDGDDNGPGTVTSTPLVTRSTRHYDAIRRRAAEIEADDTPVVIEKATSQRPTRHSTPQLNPSYHGAENESSKRPWYLPNMIGLSEAGPTTTAGEGGAGTSFTRRHQRGSYENAAHHLDQSDWLGGRLYSLLLSLLAFPLVLLHYLSLGVRGTWRAATNATAYLYRLIFTSSGSSSAGGSFDKQRYPNGDTSSVWEAKSSGRYTEPHHQEHYRHRRTSEVSSSGLCGGSPCSRCCLLFLLLPALLLCGYLLRPAETPSGVGTDGPLFGLLPSDDKCHLLAGVRGYVLPEDASLASLRWRCLGWSLQDSSIADRWSSFQPLEWIKQTTSAMSFFGSSMDTRDSIDVEPSSKPAVKVDDIDSLLARLQGIGDEIARLSRQVVNLKTESQTQSAGLNKEVGRLGGDLSQLHTAVDDLRHQIDLLSAAKDSSQSQKQQLIDELVSQAIFVSKASLDAHLSELRAQVESMIAGAGGDNREAEVATQAAAKELEKIAKFEKALGELRGLVTAQKSDLEERLTALRREFETHKADNAIAHDALNAKVSGDVVDAAAQSRSDLDALERRMGEEVMKIAARITSMERLNQDLNVALKNLVEELAALREQGVSKQQQQEASTKAYFEALVAEMRDGFVEKVAVDLKAKIVEELTQAASVSDGKESDSSSLQLKLLSLIRATVDERLKETFSNTQQSATTTSVTSDIPASVLAHLDVLLAPDGTGKADFALESAGGTIVSTRCTRTYTSFKSAVSVFGITLAYWSRSPNEILQPGVQPGECWCFHGNQGQVIVRLAAPIHMSGVSLEHIPRVLAHTGRIDSAPRDFLIRALDTAEAAPEDGEVLGSFTYDDMGKPIQHFSVKNRAGDKSTEFVELEVTSNHGHPNYTCIYRLRVHGRLAKPN